MIKIKNKISKVIILHQNIQLYLLKLTQTTFFSTFQKDQLKMNYRIKGIIFIKIKIQIQLCEQNQKYHRYEICFQCKFIKSLHIPIFRIFYIQKKMLPSFKSLKGLTFKKYPSNDQPSENYDKYTMFDKKPPNKSQDKQDHIHIRPNLSSRVNIKKEDVKKIIGKARLDSPQYGRYTFYLIKWKGKSMREATWEHPQYLQNVVCKILPFNVNIRGKQLPYFDPKYKTAEPSYLKILNIFIQNFLTSKRSEKINSPIIHPQQIDQQQQCMFESNQSSKPKTKKIKKKKKNSNKNNTGKKKKASFKKKQVKSQSFRQNKNDHKFIEKKKHQKSQMIDAALRQCFSAKIAKTVNKHKQKEQSPEQSEYSISQTFSKSSHSDLSVSAKIEAPSGTQNDKQDQQKEWIFPFENITNPISPNEKECPQMIKKQFQHIDDHQKKLQQRPLEPGEMILDDFEILNSRLISPQDLYRQDMGNNFKRLIKSCIQQITQFDY